MKIHDTHKYAFVAVPVIGGDNNAQHFIVTPVDTPSTEAHPYLEVVAPATLPEGYTFEAEANGHNFTVKVPVGGAEQGQKFSVPVPAGANGYSGAAIPRVSMPVGHWKDGFCDCFRLGVIHPVLLSAWWCPLILVGQVMHRHKLTWLGNEGTIAQTTATFRICLSITLVYIGINQILRYLPFGFLDEYGNPTDTTYYLLAGHYFLAISLTIFTIILVAKTRKRIRSKYGIPEHQCVGCEDCCCSFWCNCCTVAQMARHAADSDHDTYEGLCCSETMMPPHAPSIV